MHIFFSAGEPSGDLHTASLIRSLQQQVNGFECVGFGGRAMERAGCRILFPLAEFPVIGFLPVLAQLGRFLDLASQAGRQLRACRPDAVVLVDYPGFNWWIARRARALGIPVFYFLPPQLWAWATWRVWKMRRLVDHVMCSLPFEVDWYRRHRVPATFTGHPYFDELRAQQLDARFLAEFQTTADAPVIGILPGSRTSEVRRIFPIYLRAAQRIAAVYPRARFPVACWRDDHFHWVRRQLTGTSLPVHPFLGKTPEIIRSSHACMSKSGSVSLELLYHATPSTVLYQVPAYDYAIYRTFRATGIMAARYISLVNLLADRELFPEYVSCSDVSPQMSRKILDWIENPADYARVVDELVRLRNRVAQPGSSANTARYICNALGVPTPGRVAA